MAYKSALLAEVARAHPERAETKKKEWLQWTDEMRRASLELAETTKAKKAKEVKSALIKLNASRNDCHGTFTEK